MSDVSSSPYIDFRGWRFRAPFRCMSCGRPISIDQFGFSRLCGDCDRPLPGQRHCFSGPRELVDARDPYFIAPDRWDNDEKGLPDSFKPLTFPRPINPRGAPRARAD